MDGGHLVSVAYTDVTLFTEGMARCEDCDFESAVLPIALAERAAEDHERETRTPVTFSLM